MQPLEAGTRASQAYRERDRESERQRDGSAGRSLELEIGGRVQTVRLNWTAEQKQNKKENTGQ